MKKLIGFVFVLALFSSCAIFKSKDAESKKVEIPKIENMKDVVDNHMKRVMVEGIYTQVDVRAKREDNKARFAGHVCLKLEDNTQIFIYVPTSPEAVRARKEIREMENQLVRAVGIIYKHMPKSDVVQQQLSPQIISSPYLSFIETFELVNPPVDNRRRGR